MSLLTKLQSSLKEKFTFQKVALTFFFSLSCELLVILYLFFFFLWTAEVFLPGFISLRINLAPYIALLLGATFGLVALGEHLDLSFPDNIRFEKTLISLCFLWGFIIVSVSLIDFPWWTILFLLAIFIFTLVYFYQTIFTQKKENENPS